MTKMVAIQKSETKIKNLKTRKHIKKTKLNQTQKRFKYSETRIFYLVAILDIALMFKTIKNVCMNCFVGAFRKSFKRESFKILKTFSVVLVSVLQKVSVLLFCLPVLLHTDELIKKIINRFIFNFLCFFLILLYRQIYRQILHVNKT